MAVLGVGVVWACLPYLAGLLGAAVLCVIATPIYRRLAPAIGKRTSSLVLTIGACVLVAAPALLLLVVAIQEAPLALQRTVAGSAFARLSALHVGPLDIGAQLSDAGRNIVSWGSTRAVAAAAGVTHVVVNLLIGLVGFYYLLPAAPALWRRLRRLIPFSPSGADRLAERFTSITRAALLSIVATGVTQGLTVGLGFRIVGLPNSFFWGVATGMVSILPIFGSSLIWVPGVAVLFLDGRMGSATTLALIGFIISANVDNLVLPIIYRRVSGLHPMTALLGAFAGMKTLGILGLLLGPLALTYCLELYALYEAEYGTDEPTDAASQDEIAAANR
jgi:predicted PurR-regulated permease PerM